MPLTAVDSWVTVLVVGVGLTDCSFQCMRIVPQSNECSTANTHRSMVCASILRVGAKSLANSFHTCRCVLSVSPASRMRPKPLLALPRRRPGLRPMPPRRAPQGVVLCGRVAAPRRCHDDQDVRQRRLLASTAPCRAHPSRIAPPRASPRASPLARPRHTPYALLMQASAVGAALPLPPLSSSSVLIVLLDVLTGASVATATAVLAATVSAAVAPSSRPPFRRAPSSRLPYAVAVLAPPPSLPPPPALLPLPSLLPPPLPPSRPSLLPPLSSCRNRPSCRRHPSRRRRHSRRHSRAAVTRVAAVLTPPVQPNRHRCPSHVLLICSSSWRSLVRA